MQGLHCCCNHTHFLATYVCLMVQRLRGVLVTNDASYAKDSPPTFLTQVCGLWRPNSGGKWYKWIICWRMSALYLPPERESLSITHRSSIYRLLVVLCSLLISLRAAVQLTSWWATSIFKNTHTTYSVKPSHHQLIDVVPVPLCLFCCSQRQPIVVLFQYSTASNSTHQQAVGDYHHTTRGHQFLPR